MGELTETELLLPHESAYIRRLRRAVPTGKPYRPPEPRESDEGGRPVAEVLTVADRVLCRRLWRAGLSELAIARKFDEGDEVPVEAVVAALERRARYHIPGPRRVSRYRQIVHSVSRSDSWS